MTFSTQLQTFQGSNSYQNLVGSNCIPKWNSGIVYITGGQSWTTMAGVQIIGGNDSDFFDLSTLNDPVLNVSIGTGYPWGIDEDGQLYCRSGLGMSRIDPTLWTRNDTWGALSYGVFPPPLPACTGSNDALGGVICVTKNNSGTKYWISGGVGGFGFFGNDVYLQSGDEFAGLHYVGYDPGYNNGCNGPNGTGIIYYGTHSTSTSDPFLIFKIVCVDGAWVPADWPTPNSSISKTTLASIDPTDIDPSWTNIQLLGMALCKVDNNIIAVLSGDAGSLRYLVKIDSGTGAILWSTAIDNNINPGQHFRFSNIYSRVYLFVTGHIYGYNTSDGSLIIDQTTGVENLLSQGQQMYDDVTGVIIGNFNLTSVGADSPEILNTTPALITNSPAWMALYAATPLTPPAGPQRRWGVFCRPEPLIVPEVG